MWHLHAHHDSSDRTHSFGLAYGLLIKELASLAASIFAVDKNGIITYRELVAEVTHEPNYDATEAARAAV